MSTEKTEEAEGYPGWESERGETGIVYNSFLCFSCQDSRKSVSMPSTVSKLPDSNSKGYPTTPINGISGSNITERPRRTHSVVSCGTMRIQMREFYVKLNLSNYTGNPTSSPPQVRNISSLPQLPQLCKPRSLLQLPMIRRGSSPSD